MQITTCPLLLEYFRHIRTTFLHSGLSILLYRTLEKWKIRSSTNCWFVSPYIHTEKFDIQTGQHLHRNNSANNIVAKHKNKSLQNNSTTAPANLPLAIANASLPALPFAENQSSANLVWPNIVTTEFMAQIMPVIYCLQPLSIIPAYLITPQFIEPSSAVHSQPNTAPYCTQYELQIVNYW